MGLFDRDTSHITDPERNRRGFSNLRAAYAGKDVVQGVASQLPAGFEAAFRLLMESGDLNDRPRQYAQQAAEQQRQGRALDATQAAAMRGLSGTALPEVMANAADLDRVRQGSDINRQAAAARTDQQTQDLANLWRMMTNSYLERLSGASPSAPIQRQPGFGQQLLRMGSAAMNAYGLAQSYGDAFSSGARAPRQAPPVSYTDPFQDYPTSPAW